MKQSILKLIPLVGLLLANSHVVEGQEQWSGIPFQNTLFQTDEGSREIVQHAVDDQGRTHVLFTVRETFDQFGELSSALTLKYWRLGDSLADIVNVSDPVVQNWRRGSNFGFAQYDTNENNAVHYPASLLVDPEGQPHVLFNALSSGSSRAPNARAIFYWTLGGTAIEIDRIAGNYLDHEFIIGRDGRPHLAVCQMEGAFSASGPLNSTYYNHDDFYDHRLLYWSPGVDKVKIEMPGNGRRCANVALRVGTNSFPHIIWHHHDEFPGFDGTGEPDFAFDELMYWNSSMGTTGRKVDPRTSRINPYDSFILQAGNARNNISHRLVSTLSFETFPEGALQVPFSGIDSYNFLDQAVRLDRNNKLHVFLFSNFKSLVDTGLSNDGQPEEYQVEFYFFSKSGRISPMYWTPELESPVDIGQFSRDPIANERLRLSGSLTPNVEDLLPITPASFHNQVDTAYPLTSFDNGGNMHLLWRENVRTHLSEEGNPASKLVYWQTGTPLGQTEFVYTGSLLSTSFPGFARYWLEVSADGTAHVFFFSRQEDNEVVLNYWTPCLGNSSRQIWESGNNEGSILSTFDIEMDGNGMPHVVWSFTQANPSNSNELNESIFRYWTPEMVENTEALFTLELLSPHSSLVVDNSGFAHFFVSSQDGFASNSFAHTEGRYWSNKPGIEGVQNVNSPSQLGFISTRQQLFGITASDNQVFLREVDGPAGSSVILVSMERNQPLGFWSPASGWLTIDPDLFQVNSDRDLNPSFGNFHSIANPGLITGGYSIRGPDIANDIAIRLWSLGEGSFESSETELSSWTNICGQTVEPSRIEPPFTGGGGSNSGPIDPEVPSPGNGGTTSSSEDGDVLVGQWNGFLGQFNYFESRNECDETIVVSLEMFDSEGISHGTVDWLLEAREQFDYSLNEAPGFSPNSIGTLTASGSIDGCLAGNVAIYLPPNATQGGVQGSVVALNGWSTGQCLTSFNSFNPSLNSSDSDLPTLHWMQISNGQEAGRFTLVVFGENGSELSRTEISLARFQRTDINLASGIENRYGYISLIPANENQNFIARLYRYGQDQTTVVAERSTAFTLVEGCLPPLEGTQVLPVSRGAGAVNWVEVTNPSLTPSMVEVEIFGNVGGLVERSNHVLAPGASLHLDGTVGFAPGESGWVKVSEAADEAILTKSTSYLYRNDGRLLAASTVPGRSQQTGVNVNSAFNTYLNQINWARLFNFGSESSTVTISAYSGFGGDFLGAAEVILGPISGQDLNLNSLLNLPEGTYGNIIFETSRRSQLGVEVIRVQYGPDGTVLELEPVGFSSDD